MSPEERELVTRNIANLWTFNAMFIGQLLYSLRESGMADKQIEEMLQALDRESEEVLEGPDDQLFATGLLATVRQRLAKS